LKVLIKITDEDCQWTGICVHNGVTDIPHPIFMISEQYRVVTSNVNYPLKAKRTTRVVLFAEKGVAFWFGWIALFGHDEAHPGEHLALMPFHTERPHQGLGYQTPADIHYSM
jgi:hypothetical protein